MRLERLLAPKAVAVVGATERPSIGRTVIESLKVLGFEGRVYPVNPKYETVLGLPCCPGLDAIKEPVDVVVLAVSAARVLEQLEAAARNGAGGAVIYGGGFAEAGEEGRALQTRITDLCREAGIALCGPNCMGVVSPHAKSHAYMMDMVDPQAFTGNVALISQSGSVTIAMAADVSRYGFSHIISSGNEAVVCTADYMDYVIDDPNTGVIALFTETVREPERFIAALDRAFAAGKPVVMLKTGKSARAASVIQTHTGGLAGTARTVSAVLRAHRAIEVDNMEEMSEVLAACQGKRWPKGPRLGFVTASGGHAELILDLAAAKGATIPSLPQSVREAIEVQTGHLPGDGNPVDAWGNGDPANMKHALDTLSASGVVDAVCLTIDAGDREPLGYLAHSNSLLYADMARDASEQSDVPVYLLATRYGMKRQANVERLAEAGLVNLTGIEAGIVALQGLADFTRVRPAPRRPPSTLQAQLIDHTARKAIHEVDAKRLLHEAGVPVIAEHAVDDVEAVVDAAKSIGYPVVLKVVSDDIPHRSELGLVQVGIGDESALRLSWLHMQGVLSDKGLAKRAHTFVVQAMADKGIEVIAGIAVEPGFGQQLVVGPGGVLTELLDDVAIRCLPLADGDVEAMLDETRLGTLLNGFRGAPPADRQALCAALYALADFAVVNADYVRGIDVNPLIVYPKGRGCVAVDALILTLQG